MSKAAIGIVAAVCVAAGAGGVYVATRANQAAPTAAAHIADVTAPPTSAGVEQSEAVVSDAPALPAAAPETATPAPASAPAADTRHADRSRTRDSRPARGVSNQRVATPTPVQAPAAHDEQPARPPALLAPRVVNDEPATPPEPKYVDLVIPADAVIGLQVDTPVSSDTARVEDRVTARVTRDVKVGDRVAVPAGSRAEGEVTLVEKGGKLKDRARLGVRFTSIVLADGTRVPVSTEAIYREGDNPTPASAAKIGGGAIGGAIIGGIFGGAKGAVIGSTIGGGAGTAAVMAGGRNPATLSSGSPVTVRLEQPATVTVDRE